MLFLAFLSLLLAPPAKPGSRSIAGEGATVVVQVPVADLVTVTEKPDWLFFSIEAGYEPTDDGPYANVPAEMSVAIRRGTVETVTAEQQKTNIDGQREIVKEIKRDGQVIWFVKDLDPGDGPQPMRGFQFVPASAGGVLVIDATNNLVRGMPAKNRKQIDDFLLSGLKGVVLNGKPVVTTEIQKHILRR